MKQKNYSQKFFSRKQTNNRIKAFINIDETIKQQATKYSM